MPHVVTLCLALVSFVSLIRGLHLENENSVKPFNITEFAASALPEIPLEHLSMPNHVGNSGQLYYQIIWVQGACSRFPKTCKMLRDAIPGNGDISIRCDTGEPVQFVHFKNDSEGLVFAVSRHNDLNDAIGAFAIGPAELFRGRRNLSAQSIQTSGTIRRDFSHLVRAGGVSVYPQNQPGSDSPSSSAQDYYKRSGSAADVGPSLMGLFAALFFLY